MKIKSNTVKCPHCGFDYYRSSIYKGINDREEKEIDCPVCGLQFTVIAKYKTVFIMEGGPKE